MTFWEEAGGEEILKKLTAKKLREKIAAGLDINAKDQDGHSLLSKLLELDQFVGKKKTIAMALLLVEAGAEYDMENFMNPLYFAVHSRALELMECLLKNGADPNAHGILGSAVSNTHLSDDKPNYDETVKLLIDYGANIDDEASGQAAYRGTAKVLSYLLEEGVEVNKQDERGETLLHIVCGKWSRFMGKNERKNIKEKIRLLLEKGADLNILNNEHQTPFHKIAEALTNHVICREMVERGANLSIKSNEGHTVLEMLEANRSLNDKTELMEYLREKASGQKFEEVNWEWDPEFWASMTKEKINTMLDSGAPLYAKVHRSSLMSFAITHSNTEVVKALLDRGYDPKKHTGYFGSYFNDCLLYNKPEVAKLLIEKGASPAERPNPGFYPLELLIDKHPIYFGAPDIHPKGDYDIGDWLELFLKHGADPTERGHGDLLQNIFAKYADSKELLDRFFKYCQSPLEPNYQGVAIMDILRYRNYLGVPELEGELNEFAKKDELRWALRFGSHQQIEAVFTDQYTPDHPAENFYGITAFQYACAFHHDPSIVELILKKGGTFRPGDGEESTVYSTFLMAAMHNSNIEMLEELIRLGDDPKARDHSYQRTALMVAAQFNPHVPVLEYLLNTGNYDINDVRRHNDADSALTHAARYNSNRDVLYFLLKNKAKKKATKGGYWTEASEAVLHNPYLKNDAELLKDLT